MPGAVAPAIANSSSQRRVWVKTLRRIAGVAVWHGVLIMACAFVLIPIVMVAEDGSLSISSTGNNCVLVLPAGRIARTHLNAERI